MTTLEKIRTEIEQGFIDIGLDGTYEWNIIQEAFAKYAEQAEIQADYDRQKASGMTDEEWEYGKAEQEQNLERLRDKLHDKIEIYVCEVEENTLIANGMLKALGMMDEVLENAEKGGE